MLLKSVFAANVGKVIFVDFSIILPNYTPSYSFIWLYDILYCCCEKQLEVVSTSSINKNILIINWTNYLFLHTVDPFVNELTPPMTFRPKKICNFFGAESHRGR